MLATAWVRVTIAAWLALIARAHERAAYSAIVPCRQRRAWPTIFTRSPAILHCIDPPRALSCCARNVRLPSRPAQYGASVQCIEPVAGSSAMPTAGAKKSAYVIHVGFAGRGHNRTADPGVELGERGDVGRERSHLLSVIHHDQ